MSAMSGAKDYSGMEPVIKFEPGNKAFIVLSVLGVIGILFGVWAFITKNQSTHRIIFYAMSIIIIIKIVIVELMRIMKYYSWKYSRRPFASLCDRYLEQNNVKKRV